MRFANFRDKLKVKHLYKGDGYNDHCINCNNWLYWFRCYGEKHGKNLMDAGYSLNVYTRTKSKAEELLEIGANWHDDPASLAKASNVIITMVGYPADAEKVYFGDNGILKNAKKILMLLI